MKVLFAPDSFSDFESAPALVARAKKLLKDSPIELRGIPMADGGEGTTLVLMNQLSVETSGHEVRGPGDESVFVPVLSFQGSHFVEAARAVGRTLLRGEKRPWRASSYGLGEVLSAMDMDHEEGPLVVGLGGSACFDGGLGLAQALGLHALDSEGQKLPTTGGAGQLLQVDKLVGPPPLEERLVCAWVDVQTPLLEGPALYGEDKGFDSDAQKQLTVALEHWVEVLNNWRATHHLPPIDPSTPWTGAAGGLGFAIKGLLDGPLLPGSRAIARLIQLQKAMLESDVVITGEGRLDASSQEGKVVQTVIAMARSAGVPDVGCLVGQVRGPTALSNLGPDWIVSASDFDDKDRGAAFDAALLSVADRLLGR